MASALPLELNVADLPPAEVSAGGLRASRAYRSLARPSIALAGTFIVVLVLGAILAPVIAPYSPFATNVRARLQPPTIEHLLGTDQLGRDVLSRVLFGARVSLLVGFSAVGTALLIGTFLGILAGLGGRVAEILAMRGMDILLSYPTILLAILIVAFFGTSVVNVVVAIAVTRIPSFARLSHAMTLSLRQRDFVEAARLLGASRWSIGWRHLLPNMLGQLAVMATLEVAIAVLIEASLGYLGLSVQAPVPTWGSIIQDGRGVLDRATWVANSAGAMLFLLIIAVNVLGDGLRHALAPGTSDA